MNDKKKRKTLYLIDGPNMAFRAFYAIGGMSNSQGLPTNALFGFTNMLLKLIRDERPDYLAITWDPKGGSFRDRVFPDYKGTRSEMPDALRAQMPHFARIADAFDVPYLCIDDFEADDVMGTLARRHEDELDVVLVTSDKDLMQLVSDSVSLFDSMKDRRISFPEVEEKFGCTPDLVPDALGIWGDSSDNIPGVKGIGEKGVKALLARWKGLDDIYEHIDEVTPPGARTKLENDRDNAYLSRDLATIRTDAPVEVGLDDLALHYPPPEDRAQELFTELEFRSLLKQFGGEMATIDRGAYRLVRSREELEELRAAMSRAGRFALDTETTSLDALRADLVGLSFCADAKVAWYVPVAHATLEQQLTWDVVRETLAPLIEDPDIGVTGQHLKYDLKVLARHGVTLDGIDGDTLLADYLLSPDRRSHKLDDLALTHLSHRMISYDEVAGDKETFAEVSLEAARDYAAEDAHVTWLLDAKLGPALVEAGLDQLYRELELPLIPVLARMEINGIAVDRTVLEGLGEELAKGIAEAEARCYEAAGEEFTIGSVKQLREILFEKLELPVIRKTKTGPSTNEQVLSELAIQHPLPRAILDYRSLVKLKNTYVDPLPGLVNPETGRIHTHYSQTTAATGRLSSTDPNMQNIPVRTEEGRRIRTAFVAPPGRVLLAADYSQVELQDPRPPLRRRRWFCRGLRAWGRRPRRDRGRAVRGLCRGGYAGDADYRQGRQLRHHLRPERLWTRPDPAHLARRSRGLHQALQDTLSGDRGVPSADPGRGRKERLCRNTHGSQAAGTGSFERQLRGAGGGRKGGHQYPGPGQRRRPRQKGDAGGRRAVAGRVPRPAPLASGSRRAAARGR